MASLACAGAAQAYNVIPQGGGNYNTWPTASAAGTPGSAYCGAARPGSSTLTLPNFYADPANSNTTTPLSLLDLQAPLQAAFDKWSAVAHVQFQFVGIDNSGLAVNDPAAIIPTILVDAFAFKGFSGAVDCSPPPNGGTGEVRCFLTGPVGCEVRGATFTPDGRTLFINVRHPGESPSERSDPAAPTRFSTWPKWASRRTTSTT